MLDRDTQDWKTVCLVIGNVGSESAGLFFFFTTVRFLFANFNSVVPASCGGESKPPSDSGSKQSAIVLYVLSFLTQF